MGVEYVIESTGLFVEAEKAAGHIEAGAKKVPLWQKEIRLLNLEDGLPGLGSVVSISPPIYKPNGY